MRPFAADSLMTIFYRITHEPPTPELPAGRVTTRCARSWHGAGPRRRPAVPDARRSSRPRCASPQELPREASIAPAGPAAGRDAPTDVPTTEHAVDLLEALAEEEIAAPRLRHAPRPARPGVKPAAAVPPAGGARSSAARRPRPDSALPADARRLRGGQDRPPPLRPRPQRRSLFFVRGNILHGTTDVEGEHLGHILVRYGFIDQATLERADAHRAPRAEAPRRAPAGEGHPRPPPPRRGHRPARARHPLRHGRPQRGRLLLRGDGGGRRRGREAHICPGRSSSRRRAGCRRRRSWPRCSATSTARW